jgi:hypothetical protein
MPPKFPLAELTAAIAAVTPIVGVSAGFDLDKSRWTIFRAGGSEIPASEDGAAWAVVQAFDPLAAPIPDISKRQALTWLISIGKTEADVLKAINAIADATARARALIDWNYPDGPFKRSNPMFDTFGPTLGIATRAQMDGAFRAAAAL